MKLSVDTRQFQDLIGKAIKGASANRLLPITGLMGIAYEGGRLTLKTTDGNNHLHVSMPLASETEEFDVVVNADLFYKLISKVSVERVAFEINERYLGITANGSYKLEIYKDSEGDAMQFIQYDFNTDRESYRIDGKDLKRLLALHKPALAKTMENPHLTGYYFGETIITTDGLRATVTAETLADIFKEHPMLISKETAELLLLFSDAGIKLQTEEEGDDREKILFTSEDGQMTMFAYQMENIEYYPAAQMKGLLDVEMSHKMVIPRNATINVLDRMALFVDKGDEGAIRLAFGTEGLTLTSKRTNASELVKMMENLPVYPFLCEIDVEMLRDQMKVNAHDAVTILYGNTVYIKMVFDAVTQCLSLKDMTKG